MKKPLLKYVLLALTLIVWSAVFYSLHKQMSASDTSIAPSLQNTIMQVTGDSLLLNYRDPFTTTAQPLQKVETTRHSIREIPSRSVPQKRPASLVVTYLGRVVRGKQVYSILKFPNEQHVLQRGDTMQGVKIVGIFEDSLLVLHDGMECTISMSR